jgi:serine/threonine protein kinase
MLSHLLKHTLFGRFIPNCFWREWREIICYRKKVNISITMQTLTYTEFRKRYDVNFKIKKEDPNFLGQGGYGAVYKGRDLTRHYDVAVKRSPTDKNLLQEIDRGKNVPIHSNIARYIDGFRVETDSDDYDVAILQYYSFGNLDQLISKQILSETQIDEILRGILEGLQFLHDGFKDDKGEHIRIIHRDLKPQNILISEYAGKFTPLISDFGISKTVHAGDIMSTGGGVEESGGAGTIVYKAPEQIQNGKIRTNLDLWAFGVMLFKILKKRLPFFSEADPSTDAFKLEVMQQIKDADISAILSQLSDQSLKYQMAVKSCLVRDNKKRVQTAQELIDILDGIPEKLAVANSLFANNNYKKAKEKFEELLQIKPHYLPAQKGLKDCEDVEKEEAQITEKLEIGYIFLNKKKYKEAQENFEIVLKKRPTQENALKGINECKAFFQEEKEVNEKITIANTLLKAYDYVGAKTNFEVVLMLRPKQEVAIRGVQECNEAIKKANNIATTLLLAKSLVQEQKYYEAKSQFEVVLRLDSDNIEAREGIGNCESEIKKKEVLQELPTDVAVKPVEKVIEELPTDVPNPIAKPVTPLTDVLEKPKDNSIKFDSILKPKKTLWEKLVIPLLVVVVGVSLVLYLIFNTQSHLKPPSPTPEEIQTFYEESKKRREATMISKGDSLFAIGMKQLKYEDKNVASKTCKEAIRFKPSLKKEVYEQFIAKAENQKSPVIREKYIKLANEFK